MFIALRVRMLTVKHPVHIIIQAVYKVYHTLGNGYLEVIYERAMMIECQKRDLFIKNQQKVNVYYENLLIGEHFVDLLVNNVIIVELKAVQSIHKNHHAQLLHYSSGRMPQVMCIAHDAQIST